MIYETVSIGIHNFAFIAKQLYHILMVKIIQTYFRYIEDAHTYIDLLNFTSSLRISIMTRFSEKKCYDYESSRSLSLHRISRPNALRVARRHSYTHSP